MISWVDQLDEVKNIAFCRFGFRNNLHFKFFINAAVDSVQNGLRQVCTRAEELHVFTNDHRAYAALDRLVIVFEVRTHQINVLVLLRRNLAGAFRC